MRSWYNWSMVLLIAAILADVVFGLDAVLDTVSMVFAVGLGMAVAALLITASILLGWIVVRDAMDEIAAERRAGLPWRWRYLGWIGITGILIDGLAGAWNAYQEHVLFRTAVEDLPFVGVPVMIALASYPLRGVEALLMKWRRDKTAAPGSKPVR